jgi:dipeptidyl aminopeptidase/acylaminoacyl peptidase
MTKKTSRLVAAALIALATSAALAGAQPQKRRLTLDELAAIREVAGPQISPDGSWVAYVVRTTDTEADRTTGDIWMVRWDGSERLQLTRSKENESRPRWSPDGRYLAFLSNRGESGTSQVSVLPRAGGEAWQLTKLPGGVDDYVWSPDGKRLALIATDPDPEQAKPDAASKKTPSPIVIDRYQFKQDVEGYLLHRREHLYLFDLAARRLSS